MREQKSRQLSSSLELWSRILVISVSLRCRSSTKHSLKKPIHSALFEEYEMVCTNRFTRVRNKIQKKLLKQVKEFQIFQKLLFLPKRCRPFKVTLECVLLHFMNINMIKMSLRSLQASISIMKNWQSNHALIFRFGSLKLHSTI